MVRQGALHWSWALWVLFVGLTTAENENKTTLYEPPTKPRLVHRPLPTNLTANPVLSSNGHDLQLNVSWATPVVGPDEQLPDEYKINIAPIDALQSNCSHMHCNAEMVPNNISWWMVPNEISRLTGMGCIIAQECTYEITIRSTPIRDPKRTTKIIYKVPECVGGKCSCRYRDAIPVPLVEIKQTGEHSVNITWTVETNPSTRLPLLPKDVNLKSFEVSFGEQHKITTAPHIDIPWYNHTNYSEIPIEGPINASRSYVINAKLTHDWKYKAKIIIIDSKGCEGSEGTATLKAFKPPYPGPGPKPNWSLETMLPVLSFLLISALVLCITLRKASVLFKRMWGPRTAPITQQRLQWGHRVNEHPLAHLSCTNGQTELNPIYVESEIEDRIKSGEADYFEIAHSRIILGREIGNGAFGRVFVATAESICRIPGPQTVAVKKLKPKASHVEVEEFLAEISTLKKIGEHPNIVTLLACCTISEPFYMVMEYIPCGDLLQYLRTLRTYFETRHSRLMGNSSEFGGHRLPASTMHRQQLSGKYIELMNSSTSDASYIQPETVPPTPATSATPITRPSVTETEYTELEDDEHCSMISRLSNPSCPCCVSDIAGSQAQLHSNHSNGTRSPGLFSHATALEYVLDPKELQHFAIQIARGMSHLEKKSITHRDLAARNILIDENKTLKISDFGLSREGIYTNTRGKRVPLRWIALESMRDNQYSSKSDVWSYAIVLWEIGTLGGFPYPSISNHELLGYLLKGGRLERPDNISKELYELMRNCWVSDPNFRPSFAEIVDSLETAKHKAYVDFNSLKSNYVFPPIEEEGVQIITDQ